MSERGAKLMKLPNPFRPNERRGVGVGRMELVVGTEVEGKVSVRVTLVVVVVVVVMT